MSSKLQRPFNAAAISSVSGRTLSASLRTGTTTETAGSGVPVGGVTSGIGFHCAAAGASYWPMSLRATVLTRRHDGPGIACTVPSRPGTKASRRAANQLRTSTAQKPPTNAAATTSLTKCATMTTRLVAITAAKIQIGTRALGHNAPSATANANAAVLCPEGRLANLCCHDQGA